MVNCKPHVQGQSTRQQMKAERAVKVKQQRLRPVQVLQLLNATIASGQIGLPGVHALAAVMVVRRPGTVMWCKLPGEVVICVIPCPNKKSQPATPRHVENHVLMVLGLNGERGKIAVLNVMVGLTGARDFAVKRQTIVGVQLLDWTLSQRGAIRKNVLAMHMFLANLGLGELGPHVLVHVKVSNIATDRSPNMAPVVAHGAWVL